MKKAIVIILMIITFIIIYFLQSNFFSNFTIWKIKPNIFIIYLLITGLFAGRRVGTSFGIIIGFILDFLSNIYVGRAAVILGIIGFLGGYLEKRFSKDSRITLILISIFLTILYELFLYILNIAINSVSPEMIAFLKIVLVECVYNSLIIIIIYPIIKKAGYALEKTFKTREMLTRYF